MKKRKKNIEKNIEINTSPAIKMSELIAQYASDYIDMGDTIEEKKCLLGEACIAWNIANLPDNQREKVLQAAAKEYAKLNPNAEDIENFLHNMRLLIQKKLRMFPDIKKTIVNALLEPVNDTQYRINIVSTYNL